jgi:hypothetical protein
MAWPDGFQGVLTVRGVARDVVSGDDGALLVLGEARVEMTAGADRALRGIQSEPKVPGLQGLLGRRLGPGFRAAAEEILGATQQGSPLALLMDDLPVVTLISGFATHRLQLQAGGQRQPAHLSRIGTCAGWAAGGAPARNAVAQRPAFHPDVVAAEPPESGDDGWHTMPALAPGAMRRRRRLDVLPGEPIRVEAYFRDSLADLDAGEAALHEYTVRGTVDAATSTVTRLEATAHVLPYVDCINAVPATRLLEGVALADLRPAVRARLAGEVGCTHLNDVLRSVADVAHLLRRTA